MFVGAEAAGATIVGGNGRGADRTGAAEGRRARVRQSGGGGSGFIRGIGDSRAVTANNGNNCFKPAVNVSSGLQELRAVTANNSSNRF